MTETPEEEAQRLEDEYWDDVTLAEALWAEEEAKDSAMQEARSHPPAL